MKKSKFLPSHVLRMKLGFLLARCRIALLTSHQTKIHLKDEDEGVSKCKVVMHVVSVLHRKVLRTSDK